MHTSQIKGHGDIMDFSTAIRIDSSIETSKNLFICSFLVFFLFAMEAGGPDIRRLAEGVGLNGHLIFALFRFSFLALAAVLFYNGLPTHIVETGPSVPQQMPGQDPLLTLRGLACLLVMFGHGLPLVFLPTLDPLQLSAWPLMGSAWAGVWVFFVLSGYLMGKGFYSGRYGISREKIGNFYKNRFKRIAPIYYTVLFLVGVLTVPGMYSLEHLWELVALALFSQQNGASMPIVGALWSVQTEVAFYALVPLLFCTIGMAVRRVSPLLLVPAVFAIGIIYRGVAIELATQYGWVDRALVPLIANLDLFLSGMLLNWIVPLVPQRAVKVSLLGCGLAILLVGYFALTFVYSRVAVPNADAQVYMNAIMYSGPTIVAIFTSALIVIFECHVRSGQQAGAISKTIVRRTQYIGTVSYAAYAWHEPIFLHVRSSLPKDIGFYQAFIGFLVALGVTIFISIASYKLIEKQFEKQKIAVPPAL